MSFSWGAIPPPQKNANSKPQIPEQKSGLTTPKEFGCSTKTHGDELIDAAQWEQAVAWYSQCIRELLRDPDANATKIADFHLNRARAHLEMKDFSRSIEDCAEVLKVAEKKPDLRRQLMIAISIQGRAHVAMGNIKEVRRIIFEAERYGDSNDSMETFMKMHKSSQAVAIEFRDLAAKLAEGAISPETKAAIEKLISKCADAGLELQRAHALSYLGIFHQQAQDFRSAADCHTQHAEIAERLGNVPEQARAHGNIGCSLQALGR